jgi:hypothetical protein
VTVIAWDGKTLAADKRAICSYSYSVTKIARVGDCLVGVSGRGDKIAEFRRWLSEGRQEASFPKRDSDDTFFTGLVIYRDGRIERFEGSHVPILVEESVHCLGSGCEFARAALHLGCDAVKAVEVASLFVADCGNGIDTLTFDDPLPIPEPTVSDAD